jgi:hypothetical protein
MDSKIYYLLYHTIPYYLEPIYLGEKPQNKKDQIIDLLAEGKSVKDIARIVHTTGSVNFTKKL